MYRNIETSQMQTQLLTLQTSKPPHMQADTIADVTIQVREQSQIEKKLSVTSESQRCSISIYVQ